MYGYLSVWKKSIIYYIFLLIYFLEQKYKEKCAYLKLDVDLCVLDSLIYYFIKMNHSYKLLYTIYV